MTYDRCSEVTYMKRLCNIRGRVIENDGFSFSFVGRAVVRTLFFYIAYYRVFIKIIGGEKVYISAYLLRL